MIKLKKISLFLSLSRSMWISNSSHSTLSVFLTHPNGNTHFFLFFYNYSCVVHWIGKKISYSTVMKWRKKKNWVNFLIIIIDFVWYERFYIQIFAVSERWRYYRINNATTWNSKRKRNRNTLSSIKAREEVEGKTIHND